MGRPIKKTVIEWLNDIDYTTDPDYVPSEFALEFINFIKMVNGEDGEENLTPVMHYKMLDNIVGRKERSANLCARGHAKSSLLAEYLFLYLAVFGSITDFGEITYALYVSDSIENGVKKMRLRVERRLQNSPFLLEYIPEFKFTDIRWYFKNKFGKEFVVTGHGVSTGVRGTVELNTRPHLAILDDLISDKDARSQTVIDSVKDVVYSAINGAMHPSKRKIIWSGTPFNARDPLYQAIESGAWHVSVYPICEEYPCKKEDFRSAWPDRFNYEFVRGQHLALRLAGKVDSFNQEFMLRIMSEEERLILDSDIGWYKHSLVKQNRQNFNFYITTDFATSEKESADWSVINVWGLNSNGDWYWTDGVCRKMLMDEAIDNLFRLAQKWKPQGVGIEVSGQQGGFIQWIKDQMIARNIFFGLAKGIGSTSVGLRPVKDKMSRFQTNAVPLLKMNKVNFPEELRESDELSEMLTELRLATVKGFKSKHDDCHPFRTLVDTPMGNVPIGLLKDGDEVFTYKNDDQLTGKVRMFRITGAKQILKITLENNDVIECSQYHPLLTENGYVVAKDLVERSRLVRSKTCRPFMILSNGQGNHQGIINQQLDAQMVAGKIGYTSTNMKRKLVKYLTDLRYITSMKIRITTNLVTSLYLRVLSIEHCTEGSFQNTSLKGMQRCNSLPNLQKRGYIKEREPDESSAGKWIGFARTAQRSLQSIAKLKTVPYTVAALAIKKTIELTMLLLGSVSNAESPFHKRQLRKLCVAQLASLKLKKLHKQDLKQNNVLSVDKHSLMVGEFLLAEKNARDYEKIVKTEHTELVNVLRVELGDVELTYNFEVSDTHNYSVENGYIVHNCIDTVTMLGEIETWKPDVSEYVEEEKETDGGGNQLWGNRFVEEEDSDSSYFV